ncbi:MAG: GC-type dockerin domain-anchored protein, partial [Phycisphaerales bacterium]
LSGGNGAEGIAFVPNTHLRAMGFVDPAGSPREGVRGMGGLMFVGHQNGGRIYAFDLDPNSNAFTFVGAYRTADTETSELFFDRSTGILYAWHGNSNRLEAMSPASTPIGAERRFVTLGLFSAPPGTPGNANIEGLAIADNADAVGGRRSLFMTIDGGGATSLLWFRSFPTVCRADVNRSGTLSVQDIFEYLALYFLNAPSADFNFSGDVTGQDLLDFLAAFFSPC